jgi:hypothetical protein
MKFIYIMVEEDGEGRGGYRIKFMSIWQSRESRHEFHLINGKEKEMEEKRKMAT